MYRIKTIEPLLRGDLPGMVKFGRSIECIYNVPVHPPEVTSWTHQSIQSGRCATGLLDRATNRHYRSTNPCNALMSGSIP